MPTYPYQCKACGHELEEFQSINAPPLERCPKCGTENLVRVIGSGVGLIFKGTGFYLTDYRKNPAPTAASPGKEEKKQTTGTEPSSTSGEPSKT